jgi:hypothetical protein
VFAAVALTVAPSATVSQNFAGGCDGLYGCAGDGSTRVIRGTLYSFKPGNGGWGES